MKYLSIFIILLLWNINIATAQNGYSVANAIPVDFTTSNTFIFNNVNSNGSTGDMQGTLPVGTGHCSSSCCSTLVYKVTIPQEGALFVESDNYPSYRSGGMLLYTGSVNATSNADLTFYTDTVTNANFPGNSCDFRDTLFIGRGYKKHANPIHWADKTTWNHAGNGEFSIPAGIYYIHFWNYNQLRNEGAASNLTFEFIPYCVVDQPEIEVEGNSVNIAIGDDTPSTADDTDFGTMITGAAPISKTFTIKNVSIHDLDINSTTITGDQASNFSITASPAATVLGNSNTTFTVEFTPNTAGENNATVFINNTDCDKALFSFDLRAFVLGTTPSSVRGNMITLDGSNDYVEFDNIAPKMVGEDSFTFEAWIKADATQTGNDRIISVNTSGGGNRILFYLDDGVLETYESSGDVYTNASLYSNLRDDAWHHVALTHDGSTNTHTVYLDGQLVASKSGSVGNFSANDLWSIGQEYDSGPSPGDYFKGSVDEVRIWKDVRTIIEIKKYMHLTISEEEIVNLPNLVAYYQFDNDDATGTTDGVKDLLGNHGILKNGGTYSASEVSIGAGSFYNDYISLLGNTVFTNTDCEINFPSTPPNGVIGVTKITSETPINLSVNVMSETPSQYWVVENDGTNNTGLGATMKLKFTDIQVVSTNAADYKVHKRGSNETEASDWIEITSPTITTNANGSYIEFTVDEFSQFYVSYNPTVLPVEITYFKGKLTEEKTTLLNWQTVSEENNEGFEIQRSVDAKEWESIGYKSGYGTTTQVQNYEYTDVLPIIGVNYYRLKQTDFDGEFEYSDIISIENTVEIKPLKIYPTLVQNQLTIENGQGMATIFNIIGQPMKQFSINNTRHSIDVSDLASGQYIIQFVRTDGLKMTKRFVK